MPSQGNIFSSLALLAWVPLALWIARRWPPSKAATLLFLIPVMFLPEGVAFKLPGLVEFNKGRIAVLWLLIGVLLFHRQRLATVRLGKLVTLALVMLLGGSVLTVFTNGDSVVYGSAFLPGHTPYDAVHTLVANMLDLVLPFVLAAAMFNGPRDLRIFLRTLVGMALVYSFLQLVELWLSPQLHNWIYGFHQSSFAQAMRGGGYRPTVFMAHGLALAMFTTSALLAAAGLYKTKSKPFRIGVGWVVAYLCLILVLSKSQAALLYSLVAVPLILFATPKLQLRAAAVLALVVLLYPGARGAGLVPVESIRDWVNRTYDEEKVGSIMMRFENEETLLERANERSVFGWGGFCRPCIPDQESGEITSVSDGDWIITLGTSGVVGFLGKYLLLLLPIFLSAHRLKRIRRTSDRRLLAALALIVGFSMFDLVPNGNFNYFVFVFAGALLGCSGGILRVQATMDAVRRANHRPALDRTQDHSAHVGLPRKAAVLNAPAL